MNIATYNKLFKTDKFLKSHKLSKLNSTLKPCHKQKPMLRRLHWRILPNIKMITNPRIPALKLGIFSN